MLSCNKSVPNSARPREALINTNGGPRTVALRACCMQQRPRDPLALSAGSPPRLPGSHPKNPHTTVYHLFGMVLGKALTVI